MLISQALVWGVQSLKKIQSASPLLDTEILLSFVLKKNKEYLFCHPEKKLTAWQLTKFKKLIKQRLNGRPIAYLVGHREFFKLNFYVDKRVLIPRPETELLVEETINYIQALPPAGRINPLIIGDTGTGSGCIIISLAKYSAKNFPKQKIKFYGLDISTATLAVAKKNQQIILKSTEPKINFIKSDLLSSPKLNKLKFNILLANLPYLKSVPKNLKFEPKTALYSPRQGLDHYEKLLKQLPAKLAEQFLIILEIDPQQSRAIKKMAKKFLPQGQIIFVKDLAGKNRFIKISA